MPKKVDPNERPFQPIEAAFLNEVLKDEPPAAHDASPGEQQASELSTARPPTTPAQRRRGRRRARPLDKDEESVEVEAPERLRWPLKVYLQPSERLEINRILNLLSHELGTGVSSSHVLRSLLLILRHAERELVARAGRSGPLKRPPNDDPAAIAAFEHRLGKILLGAFREAPPLRESRS